MAPPPPPPPPDPKVAGLSLVLLALGCGSKASDASSDGSGLVRGEGDGEGAALDTDDTATSGGTATSDGTATSGGAATNPTAGTAGSTPNPSGEGTVPSVETGSGGSASAPSEPVTGEGTAGSTPSAGGAPSVEVIEVPPRCGFAEIGTRDDARGMIEPFAVRHDDFARRVLYSWTTAEQIEELRADPTLLTRSMTSEGERGRAADVMAAYAAEDPLAALLEQPEYQRRRFAWSNPWATLLGWETENYGNHLLEIRLRPDAWIARIVIDHQTPGLVWAFADVEGNPVSEEQVLASPERLAAAYFADLRDNGCGTLGIEGALFREYFVFNEAMVESWAVYTPAIRDELDRGVRAIEAVLAEVRAAECDLQEYCAVPWIAEDWAGQYTGEVSAATLYLAALAFPNDYYRPYESNLVALLDALRQVPFAEPLEHQVFVNPR